MRRVAIVVWLACSVLLALAFVGPALVGGLLSLGAEAFDPSTHDVLGFVGGPDVGIVAAVVSGLVVSGVAAIGWMRRRRALVLPTRRQVTGFPWLPVSAVAVLVPVAFVGALGFVPFPAVFEAWCLAAAVGWQFVWAPVFVFVLVVSSTRLVAGAPDARVMPLLAATLGVAATIGSGAWQPRWPAPDLTPATLVDALVDARAPAPPVDEVLALGRGPVLFASASPGRPPRDRGSQCAEAFLRPRGAYRDAYRVGARVVRRLGFGRGLLDEEQVLLDAVESTCREERANPPGYFVVVARNKARHDDTPEAEACDLEDEELGRAAVGFDGATPDPEQDTWRRQCLRLVGQAVCGLDEGQQALLALRANGESWDDIGRVLRLAGDTARKTHDRLVEAMQLTIPQQCRPLR